MCIDNLENILKSMANLCLQNFTEKRFGLVKTKLNSVGKLKALSHTGVPVALQENQNGKRSKNLKTQQFHNILLTFRRLVYKFKQKGLIGQI